LRAQRPPDIVASSSKYGPVRPVEQEHIVDIAIIGTGNVGSGLAAGFVKAGHRVHLAAREAERAGELAGSIGAAAAASPVDAAAVADVIVLAVPFASAEDVVRSIAPVVSGKTIIDVTNPAKPDWSGPLFDGTDSGAERIAAWLPEANVVKAFNTVFAGNLGDPTSDGIALDGFVAADDPAAKSQVLDLAASLGLKPIDAGPLTAARLLEALAWFNIQLNQQPGWTWRTGWKLVGAPESRAA
jgi:NADPH-dependent F420 reductase